MRAKRYIIRPRADRDLADQAYFYAIETSSEVGHRFLVAAHRSFGLLAQQPGMGWRSRLRGPQLKALRLFRVKGFAKILILYRPIQDGIEVLRVIHGSRNFEVLLEGDGDE